MKKFALLTVAFCLLSLASLAQVVTVDFTYWIQPEQQCTTGPLTPISQVTCQLTNATTGSQVNISLKMTVNGVDNGTYDTIVTATSSVVRVVFTKIPVTLPGAGSHTITGTCTAKQGLLTYTGSRNQNLSYGPGTCQTYSGKLYLDKNGNCLFDTGDSTMANQPVWINQKKTTTDATGTYSWTVSPGSFVMIQTQEKIADPSRNGYFPIKCPDASGVICDTSSTTDKYDFGYADTTVGSGVNYTSFSAYSMNNNECGLPAPYRFSFRLDKAPAYTAHIDFGDGNDTTIQVSASYYTQMEGTFTYSYTTRGTYTPVFTAFLEDTTIVRAATPIVASDKCMDLEGIVYRDINMNCVYDSGIDSLLDNKTIVCESGGRTSLGFTDKMGYYKISLVKNQQYSIRLGGTDSLGNFQNGTGYMACPGRYQDNSDRNDLNFGISCNSNAKDLFVFQGGRPFRPGFDAYLDVHVGNRSCAPAAGTLVYELDPRESFISSNPMPHRVNNGRLEWDFNKLDYESMYNVSIRVRLSQNAAIGDTVCHTATVTVANDATPQDNVSVMCNVVTGSYDPNDKTAYINNGRKPGNVMLNTDELLYRLRFQNTGTDTAFNIHLLDTIHQNLDLNTFELVASSHPMKVSFDDENRLRFDFNNILLPDDKTNEPASHGYIYYRAKPLKNLPVGEHILNTGYIYFDFNTAIITNTTDNIIGTCEEVPAPAGEISGAPSVCRNAELVLTVPAIEDAQGYNWVLPAGASITAGQNTNQVTVVFGQGSAGGAISVRGTSACGSGVRSDNFMVEVKEQPQISLNASANAVCKGATVLLTGQGGNTYSWNNGVSDGVPFQPTETKTYTVTGTGANGCKNTASVTIPVYNLPAVTAIASDEEVCRGGAVTLSGSGAASYSWTGGITNSVAFTPENTSTYTVTGTDNNGCKNTASLTVTVNELPVVGAIVSEPEVCAGDQVVLSGSGAVEYTWNNGVLDQVAFVPSESSTYEVTGTDANGCSNKASIEVIVNPLPVISAGVVPEEPCEGQEVRFIATGAISYEWSSGVPNGESFVLEGSSAFTVTGISEKGCEAVLELEVTAKPSPAVEFPEIAGVCQGSGVLKLTGGFPEGGVYEGAGVSGDEFSPENAGVFQVSYAVTGDNGCVGRKTNDVTVFSRPDVTLAAQEPVCSDAPAFALSGGMPENGTYLGPGVFEGMFDPATVGPGTYEIIYSYTDANGCSNSASEQLTVDECSGIADLYSRGISLYPNPFADQLTLVLKENATGLEVYNSTGALVYSHNAIPAGQEVQISLSHLPAGVYLLRISGNNDTVATRITKDR